MSVKGMVTGIAEDTMTGIAEDVTVIDMTTAETETLTIIVKAITNRDPFLSESW
jgi:hypothetical protein